MPGGLFELFHFIGTNVRPLALREPIYEDGPFRAPEKDDRPVPFRLPLSRSCDPLLYDPTTKISINLASFRATNSLT